MIILIAHLLSMVGLTFQDFHGLTILVGNFIFLLISTKFRKIFYFIFPQFQQNFYKSQNFEKFQNFDFFFEIS